MFAGLKIRLTNNEGDGLRLITLMGIGVVAGLVSLWCGGQWVTRDTTARYVPQSVAAYLHASGPNNPLALPGGWSADEIARFLLPDGGRLEPGAILVWREPHAPTADEQSRLDQGGWQIGPDTWLVASAEPAKSVFAAMRDNRTIAESTAWSMALGRVIPVFPMQGIIVPAALPNDSLRDSLKIVRQMPTVIIGWDGRNRNVNGLLMSPETTKLEPRDFKIASLNFALPLSGQLVINDAIQALDPLPIFFATLENQRREAGFSLSANADKARAELAAVLAAPHSLLISDGIVADRPAITLTYPDVKPAIFKAAFKNYLDSVIPSVANVILPDQSGAREIVWSSNSENAFFDKPGGISSLTVAKANISLYIAPFQENGVVLSTIYPPVSHSNSSQPQFSGAADSGAQLLITPNVWQTLLKLSALGVYFNSSQITPISLSVDGVDESMVICGQTMDSVDK